MKNAGMECRQQIKTLKRCKIETIMIRLSEFSHNHLPSGVILLAALSKK
jgi:hypothetical protein